YIEDRREHLVAGANSRQHHYNLTAYASKEGRLLALDAEVTIDGGAYSNWPFTIGLEPGQATGNLPGPYDFRGYRVKTYCVATNKPGFLPYRGVARTGVCFAMELMIDAIARAGDPRRYGEYAVFYRHLCLALDRHVGRRRGERVQGAHSAHRAHRRPPHEGARSRVPFPKRQGARPLGQRDARRHHRGVVHAP